MARHSSYPRKSDYPLARCTTLTLSSLSFLLNLLLASFLFVLFHHPNQVNLSSSDPTNAASNTTAVSAVSPWWSPSRWIPASWQTDVLSQESEWESTDAISWNVKLFGAAFDSTQLVSGFAVLYFLLSAVACAVGFVGAIRRNPTFIKLYRDYSWCDLAFTFLGTIFLLLAIFKSSIRSTLCEEISRQPELTSRLREWVTYTFGMGPDTDATSWGWGWGWDVDSCEPWFERAGWVLVGICCVFGVVRLQFTLIVSDYLTKLQKLEKMHASKISSSSHSYHMRHSGHRRRSSRSFDHEYPPLEDSSNSDLENGRVNRHSTTFGDGSRVLSQGRRRILLLPTSTSTSPSEFQVHDADPVPTMQQAQGRFMVYRPVSANELTREEMARLELVDIDPEQSRRTSYPSSCSRRRERTSTSLSRSTAQHSHSSHSHSHHRQQSHSSTHSHHRHHHRRSHSGSSTQSVGDLPPSYESWSQLANSTWRGITGNTRMAANEEELVPLRASYEGKY